MAKVKSYVVRVTEKIYRYAIIKAESKEKALEECERLYSETDEGYENFKEGDNDHEVDVEGMAGKAEEDYLPCYPDDMA